jgi:hypothetical protein
MRNCFDSRACHWTEPVGGLRSVGAVREPPLPAPTKVYPEGEKGMEPLGSIAKLPCETTCDCLA